MPDKKLLFELRVNSAQFVEGLAQMSNYKDAKRRTIRLYMDEGRLAIALDFGLVMVDCRGSFSGKVKIAKSAIKSIVRMRVPKEEYIRVECFESALCFCDRSIRCASEGKVAQLELPLTCEETTSSPKIAGKGSRNSATLESEISLLSVLRASGSGLNAANDDSALGSVFRTAWEQLDQIKAEALKVLSPLEITPAEIDQLIRNKLISKQENN